MLGGSEPTTSHIFPLQIVTYKKNHWRLLAGKETSDFILQVIPFSLYKSPLVYTIYFKCQEKKHLIVDATYY